MNFLTKHKKLLIFYATIIIVFLFSKFIFAYDDIIIHPSLTGEMAELYNSNFEDKLTNEEIAWMKQGSTDEDKSLGLAIRSENHFYNPNGNKEWVDNSFRKDIVATPLLTSKEWAHNRLAQVTFPGGDYTWETALSDYAVGDKKRAYQGLGHILHLIEDAAVPAHTRNDLHISPKELEDYNNGSVWKKILGYYLTDYEPYESWTGKEAKSNGLEFGFAGKLLKENKKPIVLDNLDKYFDNMAFYSNKNFFSKDTIDMYSEPNNNIFEGKEKSINGKIRDYIYSLDENREKFRLAEILIDKNTGGKVYDISDATPDVHLDYWPRLASNAVLNGAGVIKLFKEKAEKFKNTPKLSDINPLTRVFYDIGRAAEYNTGPVLIRNYFTGKQLLTNFAVYGLKEEAKLAGNTIINTSAIINNVLMNEYRRAQEITGEAKTIVSITYNNVKSAVEVKYNRAQEVGLEAEYIVNVARRGILSGIKNLSDPVFSGIKNRLSMFGAASIANPDAKEMVKKDNIQDQIGFLQKNESISGQNFSFIGPKRAYGPFKENASPLGKVSKILPPVIQENFDAEEMQPDNENISGPENTGDIFISDNDQDSAIVNGSGNVSSQENSVSGLSESIYSPPVISASAELLSYSSASVLTPTPTSTPTPTLVPTTTPSPQLTPTLTPTPVLSPTPMLTSEPSALPGKITDLAAKTGEKRGQIALSWSAPANAFSYDIIYSDIPFNESYASEYFVLNIAADNTASQNLSLDNLAPGKEFFFAVEPKNTDGNASENSNIASAVSNAAADYPVISEIQIDSVDGTGGADDDWVELYNPTADGVSLAGWSMQRKLLSGNIYKKEFASGAKISAYGYYLVVSTKSSVYLKNLADMTIGWNLTDNNTVYLVSSQGEVVDKIGFGSSGAAEAIGSVNPPAGGSLERKAVYDSTSESMARGKDKYSGNAWDSNDNSQDFIIRDNPDPRGANGGYTEPRENAAPAITILKPQNSQFFLQGETIDFSANISDAEDLVLPNEKISWVSDKQGPIGSGKSFSFNNFPSGSNEIVVNAVDSDNASASAYADIFIRNNSWQNLGQIKDAAKNRNLNNPKIAVDSKGKTHIVAIEPVNWGDLIYYTNESGEWKSYNVLKNEGAAIHSVDIKIDASDNVYIIFELSGNCFPYAAYVKKSASGWGNPVYFSSSSIEGYSTAIDTNGEIYSVVNAVTPYNYCMKHYDDGMRFNRTINGTLQKEIIIPAPENTAIYLPQAVVDKNNVPYLFAIASSGGKGVFFTSFDDSTNVFNSWKKVNLTYDSVSNLPIVPKFDAANNIHLFIRETSPATKEDRGIWHMMSSDFKAWTEEKLPETGNIGTSDFWGWKMNPVFDARGKIHLAWQKEKSLYYQTNFSGGWSAPMNILGNGIYGMRPALAIDKSNNLHMLYQPLNKNLETQINYMTSSEIE